MTRKTIGYICLAIILVMVAIIAFFSFTPKPRAAEEASPSQVMLVLTFIMPGRRPDIEGHFVWQSIDSCWEEARAFVAAGVTAAAKDRGAVAVSGACQTNSTSDGHT